MAALISAVFAATSLVNRAKNLASDALSCPATAAAGPGDDGDDKEAAAEDEAEGLSKAGVVPPPPPEPSDEVLAV